MNREPLISLAIESHTLKFEEDNTKCGKVHTLEQNVENTCTIKEKRKENTRITKVLFESPRESVILEESVKEHVPYEEQFGDNYNMASCINEEKQEDEDEETSELTTSK